VLGGVPGGALEQLVHRRRTIKSFHFLLAGLVIESSPPIFDPLDHAVAVGRNLLSGCVGAVLRRHVGELHPVFDAIDRCLEKGLADPKDVVAQEANGAIPVVDRPLVETLVGNLADIALRCAEYIGPLREQCFGGKRRVAGALQADKLGDVFKVLTENVLAASREHRHGAHAELNQLFFSRRIVHHVNRDEVDALFRKKLFRSQATASTRLGEQDEFVSNVFHGQIGITED
jgi:hypothetical protein